MAVVVVKWSLCLPSISTMRVRIPLMSTISILDIARKET